jgi:hypothetical protein
MVKVLSFDVGIINLAYCIFDSVTLKILHWEIITLDNTAANYSKLYINLIKALDLRPHLLDTDNVLIEKQPSLNPKMRIIAGCLQTYFFIRGVVDSDVNPIKTVEFFSPKNKLKCYTGPELTVPGKSRYAQTKQRGVLIAKSKLTEYREPLERLYFFENSKKKDDLADCYIQALTYCTFKKIIPLSKEITEMPVITKLLNKTEIKKFIGDSESISDPLLQRSITDKFGYIFPLKNSDQIELLSKLNLKRLILKLKT